MRKILDDRLITVEPMDRDCILNSVVFKEGTPRWTPNELQYGVAADIFQWICDLCKKNTT